MKNINSQQPAVAPARALTITEFLHSSYPEMENGSHNFKIMEYTVMKFNELSQRIGRRFSFDDNGGGYQGL
ncbi:MAG TPA: hypothetical protein VJ499_15780 [Flavisolibacter sp.]|nr:hypothetical protein [Flavisolibacter sp.]